MAYLHDDVFDQGLTYARDNGTTLYICSADPGGNYALATSNYALGNSSVTMTAPSNYNPDGRKVQISAINNGSVTATGTASHWALTNGTNKVIASSALTTSVAVTDGDGFNLTFIEIALRDA